jgi:hypothetical protein
MSSLSFKFKLGSLSGIANIIVAACNSGIPQANLHAVLNFVCKELWPLCYIIFECFVI